MIYLIDSDWVADYLKGRSPAAPALPGLAQQGGAISLITFCEIYDGIYFGRNPGTQEQDLRITPMPTGQKPRSEHNANWSGPSTPS